MDPNHAITEYKFDNTGDVENQEQKERRLFNDLIFSN